jgi:hypothetical protein
VILIVFGSVGLSWAGSGSNPVSNRRCCHLDLRFGTEFLDVHRWAEASLYSKLWGILAPRDPLGGLLAGLSLKILRDSC